MLRAPATLVNPVTVSARCCSTAAEQQERRVSASSTQWPIMANGPQTNIAPSRPTRARALAQPLETSASYRTRIQKNATDTAAEYAIAANWLDIAPLSSSKEGHPKIGVDARLPHQTPKGAVPENVVKPAQMCLKLAGVANATR